MTFKAFLKRCLMEYFVITTCVTAAIAVLGQSLDPEASFGYDAFFSPLVFGFISLIPSVVTYSRKELSLRQARQRKALYVLVLETVLLVFGFWAGILHGFYDAFFFALTVLTVYLAVNVINWRLDKKDAGEINKLIKSYQGKNQQE